MPLVSGSELWACRGANQRALPHFDVGGGNLDMIWAVCKALKDEGAVAFLASTPASIKAYHGFDIFTHNIRLVTERFNVYVAAHLDHATDLQDIREGLKAGCTSVMFDGSRLSLDENIKQTRLVVDAAHRHGVTVEGEVGAIGGKEDETDNFQQDGLDLVDLVRFVSDTGVDYFAPAIGTQHGFYNRQPVIQWDLALQLAAAIHIPLVLHGATDLSTETCHRLVAIGFKKVNYATGVRNAFREGVLAAIEKEGTATRPQTYLGTARQHVKIFVTEVIRALNKREQKAKAI